MWPFFLHEMVSIYSKENKKITPFFLSDNFVIGIQKVNWHGYFYFLNTLFLYIQIKNAVITLKFGHHNF